MPDDDPITFYCVDKTKGFFGRVARQSSLICCRKKAISPQAAHESTPCKGFSRQEFRSIPPFTPMVKMSLIFPANQGWSSSR
jgi:hypothetical protein